MATRGSDTYTWVEDTSLKSESVPERTTRFTSSWNTKVRINVHSSRKIDHQMQNNKFSIIECTIVPPKFTTKLTNVVKLYFYRPERSWGKVIFSQASVILSTARRGEPGPGGGAWSWGEGVCSRGVVPGGDPLGRLLLRAVRILLECILVYCKFN